MQLPGAGDRGSWDWKLREAGQWKVAMAVKLGWVWEQAGTKDLKSFCPVSKKHRQLAA